MIRTANFIGGCLSLLLQLGCNATVVPPTKPANPTVVYLCDYGVHSSLLLPVGDPATGTYVEYLYGDWNWAALNHNHWWDAVGAIFISRQATLGRRYVIVPPGQNTPAPYPPPKRQISLIVNGTGCQSVVKRMDTRWKSHAKTATTPTPGSWFFSYVKDDQGYSWLHDCNHQTGDSLHQMGCEIHGIATFSDFTVIEFKQ